MNLMPCNLRAIIIFAIVDFFSVANQNYSKQKSYGWDDRIENE